MALALVSMPEEFEQWTSWGQVSADKLSGKIRRLGVNFGAPGDRKTEDGTLWLDYPNIGGPSPELTLTTEPGREELEFFYHHSTRLKPETGVWPWVAASGVRGLRALRIGGLVPGLYRVNLVFLAAGDGGKPFDVSLQSEPLLKGFDVSQRADGTLSGIGKTAKAVEVGADGMLVLAFQGASTLSGVELIRSPPFLPSPIPSTAPSSAPTQKANS